MRVIVFVKANAQSEAGEMPTEEMLREMGAYNAKLVEAGIMEAGEGLHPSSRGRRLHFSGKDVSVTEGPFSDAKELVSGFWIWKVKDMNEATDWLKRAPFHLQGTADLEIRPVFTAEDFGPALTPELRAQQDSLRAQVEKQKSS